MSKQNTSIWVKISQIRAALDGQLRKTESVAYKGKHAFDFMPLEDLDAKVQPLLAEHRLFLNYDCVVQGSVVVWSAMLRDLDTGELAASNFPTGLSAGASIQETQHMGAACTYSKRQALLMLLGSVVGDKCADGMAQKSQTGDVGSSPASPTSAKKPSPPSNAAQGGGGKPHASTPQRMLVQLKAAYDAGRLEIKDGFEASFFLGDGTKENPGFFAKLDKWGENVKFFGKQADIVAKKYEDACKAAQSPPPPPPPDDGGGFGGDDDIPF